MAKIPVFTNVQLPSVKFAHHDLTHDVKLSMNMGDLVPSLCLEVLPTDSIRINNKSVVRVAPMLAPVMQRMDVYHDYFFVPMRLLWKQWDEYITQTKISGSLPAHPYMLVNPSDATTWTKLSDYLGIPPLPAPGAGIGAEMINIFPFACYQFIWNEMYRDENLIAPVFPIGTDFTLSNGNNTSQFAARWGVLRKRAYNRDYFTSCLPFTQKGDPVTMPYAFGDVPVHRNNPGTPGFTTIDTLTGVDPLSIAEAVPSYSDPSDQELFAETSQLSGSSTINDLRKAFAIQKYLERLARAGTRFTEWLKGTFGINSADSRLQRPQFIRRVQSMVNISEVLQTSATSADPTVIEDTPMGTMAGHGVSIGDGSAGTFKVPEHGFIMCMTSILPKRGYMNGLNRMFCKTSDPFDYFTPDLANLGEQAVLNRELIAFTDTPDGVFGYLPQYTDYRYQPNRVCGDFRTTLNYWHLTPDFDPSAPPALNQAFIECDSADNMRIFAVTDPSVDHFYCDILHELSARRPVPLYGTPGGV